MNLMRYKLPIAVALLLLTTLAIAQDYQRRSWRRSRGYDGQRDRRNGVPEWEKNSDFEHDVFTFVRIQYDSFSGQYGYGPRDKWRIDYPDADLNLSYRLQQLTSLKVDPDGKIMRLTDPALFDHPFIYIIEPGMLVFSEAEVVALRRYLTKGGFLMVDDFWGEYEWNNFADQMKRVFPDRPWVDIPLQHEIFQNVYQLKEKPLIPSVHHYLRGNRTERYDAGEAHYRGYLDDDGRIMAFICHNTDLGDGWEREGVDQGYFETYSEPFAYPLGINIVTYAMTH
jgi:hypothetical protein